MTPREKAERIFRTIPATGCWVTIPSMVSAEIIGLAGLDFGLIDFEHGPASLETALQQMIALKAGGTPVVARVPDHDPAFIKRALDLGPRALMVPNVETVAEAEAVIRAFRYPPEGIRGNASRMVRAAAFGLDAEAYVADWNRSAFLVLQIETPTGLANAGDIAALDGCDALFFGPSDFASVSGADAAGVREALLAMKAAAAAAGCLSGAVPFEGMDAQALRRAGIEIVPAASDISLLRNGAAALMA